MYRQTDGQRAGREAERRAKRRKKQSREQTPKGANTKTKGENRPMNTKCENPLRLKLFFPAPVEPTAANKTEREHQKQENKHKAGAFNLHAK